jgi:hypothetical protein
MYVKAKSHEEYCGLQNGMFNIELSCVQSLKKCVACCSLLLSTGLPKTTIWSVLHKWLRLHAYGIQLRHAIKDTDALKEFNMQIILTQIDEDFLRWVFLANDASFHINGHVDYGCQIWGTEQPHEITEYVSDTQKVNICYGLP